MQTASDLLEAIGNTPLIRLKRASEETGCEILGKAEFANPGQSVKDRAALYLIRDAFAKGAVKRGGTVVEGTAGNTGIGLTVVGNVLGLKTIIVMPDTQSEEKKAAIRLLGATLVEVPAAPFANQNNYVHYSRRLAETLAATCADGAFWANQFDNVANRDGHAGITAPEIWNQLDGKIDGFVASVGTGGTLAGIASGLRDKSKTVKIALADPYGANLFSYYTTGDIALGGILDHRGHRPEPDHQEPRGLHPGLQLSHRRRDSRIDRPPAGRRGRLVRRLVERHQHRRRDCPGQRPGARKNHRDRALRSRHPLRIQAVQPGLPAVEAVAHS